MAVTDKLMSFFMASASVGRAAPRVVLWSEAWTPRLIIAVALTRVEMVGAPYWPFAISAVHPSQRRRGPRLRCARFPEIRPAGRRHTNRSDARAGPAPHKPPLTGRPNDKPPATACASSPQILNG